jgi:hypothetical protein
MFKKLPPAIAGLHFALAVESLRLAEVTLKEFVDLDEWGQREQGELDTCEAFGFLATCRLFISVFDGALGIRQGTLPTMMLAIRERVEERDGLESAAAALEFAAASLVDGYESLDGTSEWYEPAVAAHDVLEMIRGAIECARVHQGEVDLDERFFSPN